MRVECRGATTCSMKFDTRDASLPLSYTTLPPYCSPTQPACFTNYTIYFGHLRGLNGCGSISLPHCRAPPHPSTAVQRLQLPRAWDTLHASSYERHLQLTLVNRSLGAGARVQERFLSNLWYIDSATSSGFGLIIIHIKIT